MPFPKEIVGVNPVGELEEITNEYCTFRILPVPGTSKPKFVVQDQTSGEVFEVNRFREAIVLLENRLDKHI